MATTAAHNTLGRLSVTLCHLGTNFQEKRMQQTGILQLAQVLKIGTAHTMSLKLSKATKASSQRLAHSLIKEYGSLELEHSQRGRGEWPSASGLVWKWGEPATTKEGEGEV